METIKKVIWENTYEFIKSWLTREMFMPLYRAMKKFQDWSIDELDISDIAFTSLCVSVNGESMTVEEKHKHLNWLDIAFLTDITEATNEAMQSALDASTIDQKKKIA